MARPPSQFLRENSSERPKSSSTPKFILKSSFRDGERLERSPGRPSSIMLLTTSLTKRPSSAIS